MSNILIIFILLSFQCSHIFIVDATFNAEYYTKENHVEKVSGWDENEEQESLIMEKFRNLLGLKSFGTRKPGYKSLSPLPSPGHPGLAPAPAPVFSIHRYFHHTTHHHHRHFPSAQKIEKKDNGKAAQIIAASVVSAAVFILLCAAGIFWCYRKMKQRKKKSIYGIRGKSKYVSSLSSVKKVTSDPGPDLFYINSLEIALESEPKTPKQDPETFKCSSNEREESENGDCSASREITRGHDPENGYNSSGDNIIEEEGDASSDDESFHSFSDSHSAKNRLSNASSPCSFGDNGEILSPDESKASNSFMVSPPSAPATPPPPPPPPPPPGVFLHHPARKILSPPTLSNVSIPSSSSRGFPPPPRPPPIPNGISNSLKGPPPPAPPPQFSQFTALDKDGSPLQKLKPLHWDKVRAAPDRSTVWDKLRSSSFEFDEEMIKSLFGYSLQNSLKNDESKSKTPSPSKHVLEPKRLQNITILSKGLNMTSEQICDALIRGNGLSLQELEALAKMMPTKEEEGKLSNYKGDINELGSAEKFVRAMLKIPFAFSRIEAMLFRETFDDEVVHLRKSFSMLEEACKELRSSRLFLKLLEAVLKTGNRMNVGTIRGGARAFKLDALLKLSDVKATDGKTTLLHFVVQEIIRSEGFRVSESIMGKINQRSKSGNIKDKEEDYKRMGLELVSGLSTELCNVKKTAMLDLDVLASSVSNLSEGMNKLRNLVNKELPAEENNGNFVHSMRTFIKYAEKNLKGLQEDEDGVLLRVREITEYFHGDVSKEESNPLRIFVIVRDFMCMLDFVCKELRNSKAPASSNPLAPFR